MGATDPHSYLETEARIIAENDTHVAVALRVEKAVISRNLLPLAALADLIPAAVDLLASKPPEGRWSICSATGYAW
jgi:hypothetical protein